MDGKLPIIIDGPNFINKILDMQIDKDLVSKQLTLRGLREIIDKKLQDLKIPGKSGVVEFICSKKLFGPSRNKFTQEERDRLIDRVIEEIGVHVEEVDIPGSTEKGVDNMISTKIETYLEQLDFVVLVSKDRAFIPVLRRMREKGKKIIVVSLSDKYPGEIINEAYAKIDIKDDYEYLFKYSYPYFFIKDLTIENYREMPSNADDRKFNQIRVDTNGKVYISHTNVGADNLTGVKYRFETFAPYNGYVGLKAASDKQYASEEYRKIKLAWDLMLGIISICQLNLSGVRKRNNEPIAGVVELQSSCLGLLWARKE